MKTKSQKEDVLLLNEFLTGNKENGFKKIYNKYYKKIKMKLLIASRDEFLANDLTSEVFMKVYTKLESFDSDKAGLYTWINGVATNHFRDHLRKESKKRELFIDNIGSSVNSDGVVITRQFADSCLNPEECIGKTERADILKEAIINSIKKQSVRDLVHLRYFDELSYDEIAVRTETPVGTVKNVLFRARDLMKEYLERVSSKELMLY